MLSLEAILKAGDAIRKKQAGITNPKLILAGLTRKREAFARFMNKAFGDDDDFVPVDPKNIDLERITEYLNQKDVELIKPNFGNNGNNLPATTIYKMYDEEVMQEPNEEEQAEEENFIEGGLIAQNDFNNTFLPEAQVNKLEPGADVPTNTAVTMPDVRMPIATGQVTSQQVADLFPNDPTTIAAARRREAPRG